MTRDPRRSDGPPTSPKAVLLGTSGGPRWWSDRAGIATAVVVDDGFYLVDCGSGVGRQLSRAGLRLDDLRGVFVTHLHSDHVIDLAGLGIFGVFGLEHRSGPRIPIYGPGGRGAVVAVSGRAEQDRPVLYPDDPAPGIASFWELSMRAAAADLNDRYRDSLHPAPAELFAPREIPLPDDLDFDPDANPSPAMAPVVVHRDERVTVTATLVHHPPMAPAFGFRFDTEAGSVTISGDTAPCANLVRLASGTDLLLHEVIDESWIEQRYGSGTSPRTRTMRDHHLLAHTTVAQAGEIARAAGADTLALHHYVPGGRPASAWEAVHDHFEPAIVGEDLMEIPFGRTRRPTSADDLLSARA